MAPRGDPKRRSPRTDVAGECLGLGGRLRKEIVFADDKQRQFPLGGDVEGFVEAALPERAVADEDGGDSAATAQFVGHRQAGRHGDDAPLDAVGKIPALLQVLRSTPALADAGLLPHHLGDEFLDRAASGQEMPVAAVVGKYRVVRRERPAHGHSREFLADAGVHGAEEFSLGEERQELLLRAADEQGCPQLRPKTIEGFGCGHASCLRESALRRSTASASLPVGSPSTMSQTRPSSRSRE